MSRLLDRIKCRYLGHPAHIGGVCVRCRARLRVDVTCRCIFDGFAGVDIFDSCPEHGGNIDVPALPIIRGNDR